MLIGLLSSVFAGILNGSFAAPTKKIKNWEWENTWMIYAFIAMLIGPYIAATISVDNLISVYRTAGMHIVLITFLTGILYGVGSVTFGLGLHLAGLSLGYSLMVGLMSVSGALVPMLILSPESLITTGGAIILLAMAFSVAGVIFCSKAGALKADAELIAEKKDNKSTNFKVALIVCIVAGLFSSMLNISLVSGLPIAEVARERISGNFLVSFRATNVVWVITLLGAFIPYLGYTIFLYKRNNSFRKFKTNPSNYFYSLLMGFLWFLCIMLYGAGASNLGKLGTTVGWLILMAITVIAGNFWGLITGEWKDAPVLAVKKMVTGVIFLFISVILVAVGKMFV